MSLPAMQAAPAAVSAAEEAPRQAAAAARAPAIELDALTKVYPARRTLLGRLQPEKLAVDRVTLRIEEGEIFGLVGANGAGKTTLIRMLSTMVLPTSGTARVAGYDVTRNEREARSCVGLVSSNERSFYWRLTGRENLKFFARLYQIPDREADPWRDELIELLGLAEIADRRFDQYSTGEKQRMAIARGMLPRPKILLMDEPTKGVDPIGAAGIVELILGPVRESWHPTILITSHNLSEIERLCERVALMHRGRIAALGSIEELRARVRPTEHYTLTMIGVTRKALESIAAAAGATVTREAEGAPGVIEAEVSFPLGSGGFSRLVRAVIESGGDLVSCSRVTATFEDAYFAAVGTSQAASGSR